MKKKILYISTSLFPYGQAYSTRLVNLSRLFNDLKYAIHIISDFSYDNFIDSETVKRFEHATYQTVVGNPTSINRLKATYLSRKVIKDYINNNKVDYVIIGNCYDRFNFVKEICNKKNIPLILEICEWYDTSTWKLKKLNPYNPIYKKCMKQDYTKADGYITISRYLYDYFSNYSDNVIRVPTVLDPQYMPYSSETCNDKINLIHMGLSGVHKEKFKNILLALELLGDNRKKFEYNIYGSDKKTVLKNIDNNEVLLNKLSNCVKIHGRISQLEVNKTYMNADYMIFIRPQKRSSQAGFPTKLAESMIAGTPVITNNTGDISLYLKNEIHGFLIDNDSPQAIAEILNKISTYPLENKKRMRINTRKQAENSFSYKKYLNAFSQLINKINY